MEWIAARRCAAWLLMALLLSALLPSGIHAEPVTSVGVPLDAHRANEGRPLLDADLEEEAEGAEPETDLDKLMLMILIIGDVPEVTLNSTGTTNNQPDLTPLPDGSSGGVIDSSTPSHTPEPATWLLGLLGTALLGGRAACGRLHRKRLVQPPVSV
jgi:hypothetical protein